MKRKSAVILGLALLGLMAMPAVVYAAPDNDECINAAFVALTEGSTVIVDGTTTDASPDPTGICGSRTDPPAVWYRFIGNGGDIDISLCSGATWDTRISVYTGDCPALECVGYDDDGCGSYGGPSDFSFRSEVGQVYFLVVFGWNAGDYGDFSLEMTASPPPEAPRNDQCADAFDVLPDSSTHGTTVGGDHDDPTGGCGTGSQSSPGVWYVVDGLTEDLIVNVDVAAGSGFDDYFSVYEGGCNSLTCLSYKDTGSVDVRFDAGQTYYILVHGYGSSEGEFDLNLSSSPAPPRPANDECADAITVLPNSITSGSTVGGTEDNTDDSCGTAYQSSPGVWYMVEGDGNAFNVNVEPSNGLDDYLSVYRGSCGSLECVDYIDTGSVDFVSEAGVTYYILVHGYGTTTGDFDLEITSTGPPPNDACGDAIPVLPDSVTSGSTTGGTEDDPTADCGTPGQSSPGIWYVLDGLTEDLLVTVDVDAEYGFDDYFSVYAGGCGGLSCVDSKDYGSTTFRADAGGRYYILVHGYGSSSGDFDLILTSEPAPPRPVNDFCADAIMIEPDSTTAGTTVGGGHDDPTGDCGASDQSSPGVWYWFEGNGDIFTVDVEPNPYYDDYFSIYRGGCGAFECVAYADTGAKSFVTEAGEIYYVLVHGYGSSSGSFDLTLTSIPAPTNDDCTDAIEVGMDTTVLGTTVGQTHDDPTGDCGTPDQSSGGVWYSITGNGAEVSVTVDDVDGYWDYYLSMYTGGCASPVCLDDSDPGEISFLSEPGEKYLILVHGWRANEGSFSLTVTAHYPPENESCGDAYSVRCGDTIRGNTDLAQLDEVPNCLSDTAADGYGVWFKFIGDGTSVTLSTDMPGTDFDTQLHVYAGDCQSFQCVGGDDDGGSGTTSTFSFISEPGVPYFVLLRGYSDRTGDYELGLRCQPITLENDLCGGALPIECNQTVTGSTAEATVDGMPYCGASDVAPGIWYRLHLPDTAFVSLSTCDQADYDTSISVFDGQCSGLECVGGNGDTSGCDNYTSQYEFAAMGGGDYYVLVHGYSSSSVGTFDLTVNCSYPAANDDVCQAMTVDLDTPVEFDNGLATAEPGEVSPGAGTGESACNSTDGWCSYGTEVENSLWYTFEAPAGGCALLDAGPFDLQVAAYSAGDCGDFSTFTELGANDDGGPGLAAQLQLACLEPGETVWVQVDGYNGRTGEGVFSVSDCAADPLSVSIGGCPTVYPGTNVLAGCTKLTAMTAGGLGGYTYQWFDDAGNLLGDQADLAACPTQDTTYSVLVTDAGGCPLTAEYTVMVDSLCGDNKVPVCYKPGTKKQKTKCVKAKDLDKKLGGKKGKYGGKYAVIGACENVDQMCGYFGESEVPSYGCGCSGGMTELLLAYDGPDGVDVNVWLDDKHKTLLGSFDDRSNGDLLVIESPDGKKLKSKLYLELVGLGLADVVIHTSCSGDLQGTRIWPFDVVGHLDTHGIGCGIPSDCGEGSSLMCHKGGTDKAHTHCVKDDYVSKKLAKDDWAMGDCPATSCVDLTIDITTDYFGWETYWDLVDTWESAVLASVEAGTYEGDTTYTHTYCVNPLHCYEVQMNDTWGDGSGDYSVTYDGVTTPSPTGGDFDFQEIIEVGNCLWP